jgi:hypothetical protein
MPLTRKEEAILTRWFGYALLLSLVILIGATLVSRAIGQEVQQHVIFTRNGVTIDCERITDVAGRTFYDSCVRVP